VRTVPVSAATTSKSAGVIARPKVDRYRALDERLEFVARLARVAEPVAVTRTSRACRDPRDDTLPGPALAGGADVIVIGDGDLLALGPFEGIAIVAPASVSTVWPE
jgi:putative PIN family toxin of toxin-antitoxin system